jgi:hypothetical protein
VTREERATATKDNALVTGRHIASIAAGILLSRLVKHSLVSSEEAALILGFLPTLLYNVGMAIHARIIHRRTVKVALAMPEGSTVRDLKAAEKVIADVEEATGKEIV